MNKIWKVYEIINANGIVEYVGETVNIPNRWEQHICISGKFFNRKDVSLRIVNMFDNKIDAFNYQCELQKKYGLSIDKSSFTNIGIYCYDYDTMKFMYEFNSITDATDFLNIKHKSSITHVLKGRSKQCKGYYFEYKLKEE